jgi:hypothetical protein
MTSFESCCDRMMAAVDNVEIPIVFTPKFREFGVKVLDGGTSTIELLYCPWCGKELPSSLRDRWFDELDRLGIDPIGTDVPAVFQDARWYLGPPEESFSE